YPATRPLLGGEGAGRHHHHVQRGARLGPEHRQSGGLGADRRLVGRVGGDHGGRHGAEVHRPGRGERRVEGAAQRGVQGGGGGARRRQGRVRGEGGGEVHAQEGPQHRALHAGAALDGRLVGGEGLGGGGGGGRRGHARAQGGGRVGGRGHR